MKASDVVEAGYYWILVKGQQPWIEEVLIDDGEAFMISQSPFTIMDGCKDIEFHKVEPLAL